VYAVSADWGLGAGHREPTRDAADVERRLEVLADEIASVIEAGPAEERDALQDYAVSLIRDRLPSRTVTDGGGVAEETDAPSSQAAQKTGTNAVTLVGYGFLLVPVAFILVPIMPPIGVMLGLTAVAMITAGIGLAVVSRFRRTVPVSPQ
jgi:hypothetical protein